MGQGKILAALCVLLAMAPSAGAQERDRHALGFAHLHGFGEGVAAALAASTSPRQRKTVEGPNGKVVLTTYRQPGIELRTMAGGGQVFPDRLVIARPGYRLPLGLHIGDLRGAVERTLDAPLGDGDTLVLRRTRGEGCDDPVTIAFRNGRLTRVAWTWESCAD